MKYQELLNMTFSLGVRVSQFQAPILESFRRITVPITLQPHLGPPQQLYDSSKVGKVILRVRNSYLLARFFRAHPPCLRCSRRRSRSMPHMRTIFPPPTLPNSLLPASPPRSRHTVRLIPLRCELPLRYATSTRSCFAKRLTLLTPLRSLLAFPRRRCATHTPTAPLFPRCRRHQHHQHHHDHHRAGQHH